MRIFNFFRAEPTPDSEYTQAQVQTMADHGTLEEARRVCKMLSQGNPVWRDFARGIGNRQAEYLFSRFASQFGWETLRDAQRYYDNNKGTKGGYF